MFACNASYCSVLSALNAEYGLHLQAVVFFLCVAGVCVLGYPCRSFATICDRAKSVTTRWKVVELVAGDFRRIDRGGGVGQNESMYDDSDRNSPHD